MWGRIKRGIWQWRGVFIAAPSLTFLVIGLRTLGLFQLLELATFDFFYAATSAGNR